jgi:hypothetical protein
LCIGELSHILLASRRELARASEQTLGQARAHFCSAVIPALYLQVVKIAQSQTRKAHVAQYEEAREL